MGRKKNTLGDLIKSKGMTKKEVFTHLGICKQVFNDVCENPFQLGISQFIKLALFLGMDGADLFTILDDKVEKTNFLR